MQVLYIEDNPVNAVLVERIFDRIPSADLVVVPNGQLGIAAARHYHPDLILLDLHLPDMSGEDVLCQLRADPDLREISVVVLTADAAEATRTRAIALGAKTLLTKPLQVSDVIDVVTAGTESRYRS